MTGIPGMPRMGWERDDRDEEDLREEDAKPVQSPSGFGERAAVSIGIIFGVAVVGGIIWLIIIGLDHVLKAIGFVR